ncbi:twitching motility protein PilT [Bacteroidia bacterium]|nr:twitching motility protein PilT [Bacteroidia bacterium]
MRYLLDTNIFIYMNEDKELLSKDVVHILGDYSNLLYISSESIKELLHLFQTGKIKHKQWKVAQDIINSVEDVWNITIKYVKKEHLVTFSTLDRVENHNDPSDRLIIAQAITEKMPLISSDGKFEHYRKQKLQFIYNKK